MRNRRFSDSGTFMTKNSPPSVGGGGARSAEESAVWYPRVLAAYGLTESAHWSRRLRGDVNGTAPRRRIGGGGRAPASRDNGGGGGDYYGHEDADAAYLARAPVSFAVFGKPGLPCDRLADMLSAYWGCVHVSVTGGLAAGRAGARTMAALRRGKTVKAARTAAELNAVLGLGGSDVRERGYVLTGIPKHDPEFSAQAQMDAVFSANPPDVLIYMSCPKEDIDVYWSGLILERIEDDRLKQTFDAGKNYSWYNHGHVQWYKSLKHKMDVVHSLEAYEEYALRAVEEVVKQFDTEFVITVDGRRPVNTIFETIVEKLKTMGVQRTILARVVKDHDDESSVVSERYANSAKSERADEIAEGIPEEYHRSMGSMSVTTYDYGTDYFEGEHEEGFADDRAEKIRSMSEYGRLCPVNLFYGSFKVGTENHCARFMGKSYLFAGSEELRLFCESPKRFVNVPRVGLPVRAVFYGPEPLSSAAADTVGEYFGYNVIDANVITRTHVERETRKYVSALVRSAVTAAEAADRIATFRSDEMDTMRNAIGDWLWHNFEYAAADYEYVAVETLGENDGSKYEMFEDYSDPKPTAAKLDKDEQLLARLRNYFQSYCLDFVDDLDACVRVYKQPTDLITYFRDALKRTTDARRSTLWTEHGCTRQELIDIVVDTVRRRNRENPNWIITNAPLDFVLVKTLTAANLNPIQYVFCHDADPAHRVLLDDGGTLTDDVRRGIVRETVDNARDGPTTAVGGADDAGREVTGTTSASNDAEYYDYFGDEMFYNEHETEDLYAVANVSHGEIMKTIVPEITKRLDEYARSQLERWRAVEKLVSVELNRDYVYLTVVECKPADSATDSMRRFAADVLHYTKKCLAENVYDVSAPNGRDTVPVPGKHDGDTSIYCPVRYANGKLSVGSKRHMAVYQNRYYYMSSADNLETFVSNPRQYSSFVAVPKRHPQPKITLLCPIGTDHERALGHLLDTFDLVLVDACNVFAEKVLPAGMPMLGQMYEEPTLRHTLDKHFVPGGQYRARVDSLRRYMDRTNECLSSEDVTKMNSIFVRAEDGVCYKNYPRNVTELKGLVDNGTHPDVIVELTGGRDGKENAIKAVIGNWLAYQRALIDMAIGRDHAVRRTTVDGRSALFKAKLAEAVRRRNADAVKWRVKRLLEMTAAEIADGPEGVRRLCTDDETMLPWWQRRRRRGRRPSPAEFYSSYPELTKRQKVIAVNYGLTVADLLDLDDFAVLERVDETVKAEIADADYVVSECFADGMGTPSAATVERYLNAERAATTRMREYAAASSDIAWFTDDNGSSHSSAVAALLRQRGDRHALETAYDVDLPTAERMLADGEAYLSRFGRRCPVRAAECPDSVRTFYADCADGRVRPVVHRKYVYYLSGPENRDQFVRRPLDYAFRSRPAVPDVPLRIAVLGPPGSGKTRCAQRLCDRHGFQLIRIEEAAGPYLTAHWWTGGAQSASWRLRRGDVLSDHTLTEIVKSAAQTCRAAVQGYVIDGFPVTREQFKLLDNAGVILHRVFVLNGPADDGDASTALFRRRRAVWNDKFVGQRWLSEQYGNVTAVNGGGDDDDETVDASVRTCVRSLRNYLANARARKPCSLADVPVTKSERRDKMTAYLDTCPVCRTDDGHSTRPRDPAALRRGMTQYLSHFYWTCRKHRDAFADDPGRYADATPDQPVLLAVPVNANERQPWPECPHVELCVVCALARLWDPVYKPGSRSHVAEYGRRTFAFCSAACMDEFVRRPLPYSRYTMPVRGPPQDGGWLSALAVERFPDLGYLEQTVGLVVGPGLVELMAARPVYPGLTPDVTATVFLGLYVGGTDAVADPDVREYYRNAFRRFSAACTDFKTIVFRLRFMVGGTQRLGTAKLCRPRP